MMEHMTIDQLPYGNTVHTWLKERYEDTLAETIWRQTEENYAAYLKDLPDYGGKKNGHAKAIYGGLLVFALYPALPDQPPIQELQEFVQQMFMSFFKMSGEDRWDQAALDQQEYGRAPGKQKASEREEPHSRSER